MSVRPLCCSFHLPFQAIYAAPLILALHIRKKLITVVSVTPAVSVRCFILSRFSEIQRQSRQLWILVEGCVSSTAAWCSRGNDCIPWPFRSDSIEIGACHLRQCGTECSTRRSEEVGVCNTMSSLHICTGKATIAAFVTINARCTCLRSELAQERTKLKFSTFYA